MLIFDIFKISKSGNVSVKKGLKKGTYKLTSGGLLHQMRLSCRQNKWRKGCAYEHRSSSI